ncbi:MAG: Stp1/IreP family PP2C-type Ser/Thr phosphatase [Ktedonobacteraceae bacterium]|nr:Stp1/IreP family PP2C-type Ser/Thr phosphatase [Ktedonobacteraceae bacterium]
MDLYPTQPIHSLSNTDYTDQNKTTTGSRLKQFFQRNTDKTNAATGSSNPFRIVVAQRTDVGRKRKHNEDNVAYIIPKDEQLRAIKGALFIVADGMGGHAAGEVASEIAVSTVCNLYYQNTDPDVAANLMNAIKYANLAIYQSAHENQQQSGMGTTCVAAVLRGETAFIANVGDSRAYLVRRGMVKQVTQDHSWVMEQIQMGRMSEEEARTHEMRNVITRSLGPFPDVDVDIFAEQLEEGDGLVLCSDGLSGMMTDLDILRIVEGFTPQESVLQLLNYANAQGGADNITAIVVRVLPA